MLGQIFLEGSCVIVHGVLLLANFGYYGYKVNVYMRTYLDVRERKIGLHTGLRGSYVHKTRL